MTHKETDTLKSQEILRNLSSQDFLSFGIQDIAYVKPVVTDNTTRYAIHAADGTPLSILDSYDTAMEIIRHNDLEPIKIQ